MWNGRSSRHSGRVIIRRVCRLLAQAEFGGSCRLRFSGGEHSPELCIHGGAWEARSSLRKEALGPGMFLLETAAWPRRTRSSWGPAVSAVPVLRGAFYQTSSLLKPGI